MARIFITGSSDGLGLLAAQKLISLGHQVVAHTRNEERAKQTIQRIPDAEHVIIGDLSSMEETKSIATQVNDLGKFDAIIHNAGVYQLPANAKSEDGLPLTYAVNSLAPYILTALIHRPERLIYLSSNMHLHGNADLKQLNEILGGKNNPSYSDTKLHDLILALAVAHKWPEVISNAVDPGWVPTKMGGSGAPDDLNKGFATQVWLATSNDEAARISGRYLYHKKEEPFNPQAKEIEIQEKYLSVCEQISGIPFS
ncbi:SDR family NAD(P)-dependent oxidoreductase [Maribellus mangrovi]|uniref:SDR family NAD(P)-dependent oxidoreductase n=1 Tax=Maribellus mangrovi TaxID=3133146 RepID=UPI0030EE615F